MLIVLAVLVLVITLGVVVSKKTADKEPDIRIEHTTTRPDPQNGTFVFDGASITLKNGKHEEKIMPGSSLTQETILSDSIAYGDLNKDNKEDAAMLFIQSGGGSGVFVYIGAYTSGTVRYGGSNTVFIGDRITPRSISIDGGIITVEYLDRDESESLASEPTRPVSRKFVFENSELKEI